MSNTMTNNSDTTSTSMQETHGGKPRRSQTSWATDARKTSYDAAVRKALAAIRQAQRQHGVCEAELLADWLNTKAVPAPKPRTAWNKSSVLRALRRLHELGLHAGPGPAHKARRRPVSLLWPEGRRALATRKAFARAHDDHDG